MDHQSELEKSKYRNWVRGGLAFKYLKDGVEEFADEIVQQEHKRILLDINYIPGTTCTRCSIQSVKPLHKSAKDPGTGKDKCPWGQIKCSCLCSKNRPCRNKVCDAILEEILKSYEFLSLSPNWKNTDINSWSSMPWEIAKCFINAPGYADTTAATDIDAPGLLHLFINNINFQNHISCKTDLLKKTLKRRNTLFHSPKLELEDKELNECIDDIIEILEDEKELKARNDAQKAVVKLRELKEKKFIVTTHDEVEICRVALKSINNQLEDLQQNVQDINNTIQPNSFDEKIKKAVEDSLMKLDKQSDTQLKPMKQTFELLNERVKLVEKYNTEMKQELILVKQRLTDIECDVESLVATRDIHKKQLLYVEQKQEFQTRLVKLYMKHYVKSWISIPRPIDKDININEVYVTPNMVEEVQSVSSAGEETKKASLEAVSDKTASNTSTSKPSSELKVINGYQDILQTNSLKHKTIYVVGDAGAGKSSLTKMMIYNWCMAVKDDDENDPSQDENIKELKQIDFLFYIPLQRMSGSRYKITDMIKTLICTSASEELINSILERDSERCLILADGLDEWTPPKDTPVPQHVSYGIPVQDGINDATLITFSRPSSRGILNMKSSEYDKKIVLMGICKESIVEFSKKYMAKLNKDMDFINSFMTAVRLSNLEHLERTPLLLQQLICTYCEERCIGNSLGDIYSNMLNCMLHWFENKAEEVEEEAIIVPDEFKHLQLPTHLDRFPRCKINKRFIFLLGKIAFKVLTGETDSGTFGRSKLQELGLARNDITTLISLGILVEYTSLSPKYEKTCLSFIHISYLELFAAVYITSHSSAMKTNRATSILQELFMRYKSASDILHLSNMLKMVCGLCSELITEMSCMVASNIENDESMIKYRNNLHTCVDHWHLQDRHASQIQDLMMSCISEGGRKDDQPLIRLCDIVELFPDCSLVQNVDPDSVYSFYVTGNNCQSTFKVPIDFTKFRYLKQIRLVNVVSTQGFVVDSQYLKSIYITERGGIHIDHEVLEQLSSSFSKIPSLTNLTLINMRCKHRYCLGHTIELSNLYNLQNIHLESVSYMLRFPFRANKLESFYYSYHGTPVKLNHGMCEQITASFVQATSLKHIKFEGVVCIQDDCTGHSINLLQQTQLQSIHLRNFACKLDLIVEYKYLERVYISFDSICFGEKTVDDKTCKQLISQFSHVISLKELTVTQLRCDGKHCENHTFDLSKLNHLQIINVQNFSCKLNSTQINPILKEIEFVFERSSKFNHEDLEQLSLALTQAKSLYKLTLKNITCIRDDCEDHIIDLTEHDNLESIYLDHVFVALHFPADAKNLKETVLRGGNNFKLAHTACDQIASLLARAVSLTAIELDEITCSSAECEGHCIDFSKHDKLKSVILHGVSRSFVISSYPQNLEYLTMSGTHCDTSCGHCDSKKMVLKHEQRGQSPCAIPQARDIKCEKSNCDRHSIDLSKHDKLRVLVLCGCFFASNINTRSLEILKISTFPDVLNMCGASNLKQIRIGETFSDKFHEKISYTSDMNSAVQTSQNLCELCLGNIDIEVNALIVTPEMHSLKTLQLSHVKMNLKTWRKFIDSLITLSQPVLVCASSISFTQDKYHDAKQYVRQKTSLFEVVDDDILQFNFSSKKINENVSEFM